MPTVPSSYEPPPDAAETFQKYKSLVDAQKEQRPTLNEMALRELRAGASIGDLERLTGLSREVWRKFSRRHGVELKREPTVRSIKSADRDAAPGD